MSRMSLSDTGGGDGGLCGDLDETDSSLEQSPGMLDSLGPGGSEALTVEQVDQQTEQEVGAMVMEAATDHHSDDNAIMAAEVGMMQNVEELAAQNLEDLSEEAQTKLILAASTEQAIVDQGFLADPRTLQSLLSSGQLVDSNGQAIQIIALTGGDDQVGNSKLWQLVGTGAGVGVAGGGDGDDAPMMLTLGAAEQQIEEDCTDPDEEAARMMKLPPLPPLDASTLPAGCPEWATRLRDCEKLGDFYRGWVESEIELDVLLTYHKQHTASVWGTRQSPTPGKPSQRLMWKSQYVPFDGLPFINTGSRAIVMECQYGPRRKGMALKKQAAVAAAAEQQHNYKQTCPARIYIKRVRKFPTFAVDINHDKKSLKSAMDKSFQALKDTGLSTPGIGQERWYVQLPTEKAHEFHEGEPVAVSAASTNGGVVTNYQPSENSTQGSRLNPSVVSKIRSMVAGGETRLYAIRKALRRFVEKELFPDYAPEKHNLQFYPTVNDLQNHIHQAIKDIEAGILPITAQTVNVEVVTSSDVGLADQLWMGIDKPHPETVTVTLTQKPGQDGQHVISRVETRLSDGSTQISTGLTPETAKLLSKLHPNMFPPESLMDIHPTPSTSSHPGLTFMHQSATSTAGIQAADDSGLLASTPSGGVILPSGDIHQAQNGIYTVIPSENSSLLLANAISSAETQAEAAAASSLLSKSSLHHHHQHHHMSVPSSSPGLLGESDEALSAADSLVVTEQEEGMAAAAIAGGMVVREVDGGGLLFFDAQGNTLKLEQADEEEDDSGAVGLDEATGESAMMEDDDDDETPAWMIHNTDVKHEPE